MAKVTKAILKEQVESLTKTANALEKRCAEIVALSEQVKREMKDALSPAVIRLEAHIENAAMFIGAVSEELDGIKRALGMPGEATDHLAPLPQRLKVEPVGSAPNEEDRTPAI